MVDAKVYTVICLIVGAGIILAGVYRLSNRERRELLINALEKIRGVMLHLVFDAEKLYQSGTGRFKKAYVINLILNSEFYLGLPQVVRRLITFGVLSELVDGIVGDVFNVIKESSKAVKERLAE